jgi:DNA polymerase III epsilon subunit-like protein
MSSSLLHQPLAFVDIETTGGSHFNSRVLEVGVVRVEQSRVVAPSGYRANYFRNFALTSWLISSPAMASRRHPGTAPTMTLTVCGSSIS